MIVFATVCIHQRRIRQIHIYTDVYFDERRQRVSAFAQMKLLQVSPCDTPNLPSFSPTCPGSVPASSEPSVGVHLCMCPAMTNWSCMSPACTPPVRAACTHSPVLRPLCWWPRHRGSLGRPSKTGRRAPFPLTTSTAALGTT